jgi:hypothetical protein
MVNVKFDDNKLLKAGFRIVELINENIKKGEDYLGTPFAPYSPKYRVWKEAKYPQDAGKVNLTLTGNMLRGFHPIKAESNSIILGFEDASQSTLAYYHDQSGAGRSRVLRKFLGLHDKQYQDVTLVDLISEAIIIENGEITIK